MVKCIIIDFLCEGILMEMGWWYCKNGYIVIYWIVLECVVVFEFIVEFDVEMGVIVNFV